MKSTQWFRLVRENTLSCFVRQVQIFYSNGLINRLLELLKFVNVFQDLTRINELRLCKSTLLSHPCIWSHGALVLRYLQSMVLRTDDWWRDIDDVFHLLGDFWIAFWRGLLQRLSLQTSFTLITLFQSLKQKQSFDSIVTSRPQQGWFKYIMHYLTNLQMVQD